MFTNQDKIGFDISDHFLSKFGRSGATKTEGNTEIIYLTMDILTIRVNIYEDCRIYIFTEVCTPTGNIPTSKEIAVDTADAIKILDKIIRANDILVTTDASIDNIGDILKLAEKLQEEADNIEY